MLTSACDPSWQVPVDGSGAPAAADTQAAEQYKQKGNDAFRANDFQQAAALSAA